MNEGISTPAKEPVAFELIGKCHRIVEEIKMATVMLQIGIPESPLQKVEETTTPLESQLLGLVEHLQALLQSYKV